jgi:hypothetical protein
MKPTTQSDLGFAINIATIESFTLADAFFTIDFKDGSILKFKARQTVFTHGRAVQMGVVPVFPSCLLMGGLVPADGLTRCLHCGHEVAKDGSETVDNLCWDCLVATDAGYLGSGLSECESMQIEDAAAKCKAAFFADKPKTMKDLNLGRLMTDVMANR